MRWETRIQPGLCAPSAVALGYFDGVHLGHRAVLAAARAWAQEHGLCPQRAAQHLRDKLLAGKRAEGFEGRAQHELGPTGAKAAALFLIL